MTANPDWYLRGLDVQQRADRINAFGAIRRAAKMVRAWELDAGREHVLMETHESKWSQHQRERDTRLLQTISGRMLIREVIGSLPNRMLNPRGDDSARTLTRARRRAIRAAIGSDTR